METDQGDIECDYVVVAVSASGLLAGDTGLQRLLMPALIVLPVVV